jgi:hypothetical protein
MQSLMNDNKCLHAFVVVVVGRTHCIASLQRFTSINIDGQHHTMYEKENFARRLTHRCPDDGVAEVALRSIAVVEARHSDAVGRGHAQVRQHGMTNAGTEHQLLVVDGVVVVECSIVDEETVDWLLVAFGVHLADI